MSTLLLFGGTTEGRELSECLAAHHIPHIVCVATEYGETILSPHPVRTIHCGRMDAAEIRQFIKDHSVYAVVDATHPYADGATKNIRMAADECAVPYMRLKRETRQEVEQETVRYFTSNEECAKALEKLEGNILLTTGTKELLVYCASGNLRSRLYVRILPSLESISACLSQGLIGRQMIAMQGPFSCEMNEAIINQYRITFVVTKKSGRQGGFQEKTEAARNAGIQTFVIGHPQEECGDTFQQVCEKLEAICGQSLTIRSFLWITLVGIGMGNPKQLTREAEQAIAQADILIGADRLLASFPQCPEKKSCYQAGQIIPYLKQVQGRCQGNALIHVVILFSGDTGFYSGCHSVYHALKEEILNERLAASLRILPGISSVACLAACLGERYEDAAIYSLHGKKLCNLARKIKQEEKTFLLMSGAEDMIRLGRTLTETGLTDCKIAAGYQMSYENQKIRVMTPKECCQVTEEGLYTCLVKNPKAVPRLLSPCLTDDALIRGQVPMTKEEVRQVSICKLRLHEKAVVYDIGSGTGSIAVEIAGMSDQIQVYAVEQKKEAIELIRSNQNQFCLDNISIVEAQAPEGLYKLPPATHGFIGGSGGKMKEIIAALYHINPHMRVVANAITIETICEIKELLHLYPVVDKEIIELQVSRAKEAGRYHMMQAENPVWISAFRFTTNPEEKG